MNVGRYLRGEDSHVGTARTVDAKPMRDILAAVRKATKQPARRSHERDIERYLVKRAKALGGEVRKVTWQGRRFAPDRIVMLPRALHNSFGMLTTCTLWVELKAPGEKPTSGQIREHARMRALGQRVEVVDSFARVDEVLS